MFMLSFRLSFLSLRKQIRVTIRPCFPGHVLYFRLCNCVRGDFFISQKFLTFGYSHKKCFGGRYMRYSSYFSQATFQLQNLFSDTSGGSERMLAHPGSGRLFRIVSTAVEVALCAFNRVRTMESKKNVIPRAN